MALRHEGAFYHISPWGLSWDDENYYLVGYDSQAEKIKHYRVDKMLRIQMTNESREGKEYFNKLEMVNVRDIRGEDRTMPKQEDNSVPNVNESIFYMVFVLMATLIELSLLIKIIYIAVTNYYIYYPII
jgi:predicted DNA-binding transcriptional regulator YafY